MSGLALAVAAVIVVALIVYAVLGGADYGAGIWDLFATGRRAGQQRKLIEHALAPVWEANHVWLIVVAVLAFTAFPTAFAVGSIALHVPLSILLLGIVFRGSAFAFRQYGTPDAAAQARWGRLFAIASVVTPFFLGVSVGTITAGTIRVERGVPVTGYFEPWLGFFPFMVGFFTLSLFAMLAAVYLTNETQDAGLRRDFRKRALMAAVAVFAFAELSALSAPPGAAHFREAFFGSWWTWPLQIATGASAVGVFVTLWTRRFRVARVLAVAQVSLIIAGWALGQQPYLVAPDVTLADHAPDITLKIVLVALAGGAPILLPSLYYLMRVFKASSKERAVYAPD